MVATASDLLMHFSEATLAYTQSDEITLTFPDGLKDFRGRVQKIVSIAAGFASTRFNYHLSNLQSPTWKMGVAHFDARVFNVPTIAELVNCLIWRCRYDCRRNSKAGFARQYLSATRAHGLSSDEQVALVRKENGIDYHTAGRGLAQ